MTKSQYKEFRRLYRISLRMQMELLIDSVLYGQSFQYRDECCIINVPPNEIIRDDDDNVTWVPR